MEGGGAIVRKRKTPLPPNAPPEHRGGPRQGQPGRVYGNRSDLNVNRAQPGQPVRTAPSQGYGQRAAQDAAQRAIPLAAAPPVAAPPPGAGAGPGMVFPEDVPTFGEPTGRPDEPLTAGLPFGPGPGPRPTPTPPDPDLEALRPYLPALELMASMPNTSPTARNFIRRLRGSIPPPATE